MLGVLWRILAILGVLAVAFGVLWFTGLLVPLSSAGTSSMAPTIPACNGRVLAEGLTYKRRDPHRGEIVAFHASGTIGGPVTPDAESRDLALQKRVVAIPGILGKAPMPQAAGYCAAKYALTGMVKCLAQEYKRFGVRFSLMHFGGVDSSFWDNIAMRVDRAKMLSIEAAARAVFFAATQEGEGVMAEVVLMPESHQLV